MANRHFGKLGDVWKHLPLCEVLTVERPSLYAETHAGSAAYPPVDDPERRYGVHRFSSVAHRDAVLAGSRYVTHLDWALGGDDHGSSAASQTGVGPQVPGSPLLAMLELGGSPRYVLCDIDPASVQDLNVWAARLDLADRVTVVEGDGMAIVTERVLDAAPDASAFVHVDPYDPDAREPGSVSALELTARLINTGVGVLYWYGFDAPADRGWALRSLGHATDAGLWCGDMLVTAADGAVHDDGDLGRATTPGTGFGIVLANVTPPTLDRCRALGSALARAYDGAALPDGRSGALDFQVLTATAT